MPSIKIYMTLFRVSNLPTVWSNVLAAILLCGGPFAWSAPLVLIVSLSLFYCGGMALNDICDVGIDLQQRPSRPIPAGKISIVQAKTATAALFILAFASLSALPYGARAMFAAAGLAALIVLYDLYHKGNPFSVLLMAACRLMVYVVVAVGVAGNVNGAVMLVGLVQFGYIILLSIVARLENSRPQGYRFPVIPLMLACICLLDGACLAVALQSGIWVGAGIIGTVMTMAGQRYVRGD